MTKEQHEKLVKYEQIFRTAINSNYYRSMDSRFAADFIDMCQELHVYINPSCPQCVLRALHTMGKLYFAYKEPVEELVEEPKESVGENPIQDTQKPEDIETIEKPNKVSQNKSKQPKKPIVTRNKTNKK